MKYRKKPILVEAFQWRNDEPPEWWKEKSDHYQEDTLSDDVFIITLEGVMRAKPLDWIIKGVHGELYPCKPDIFAATYEQETES